MNFLFLKDFSGFLKHFFLILFSIFNNKINKIKIKKIGRGARVDATWHAGPRGSATQDPRCAYVAHILYIYYYYLI